MVRRLIVFLLLGTPLIYASAQETPSYEDFKASIIQLETRVATLELNLETAKNKFRSGILIATLGYTTTIAGGLMLGRENDQLGQVMLITGGATGIVGTYRMVDAFRYLTGVERKKKKRP